MYVKNVLLVRYSAFGDFWDKCFFIQLQLNSLI